MLQAVRVTIVSNPMRGTFFLLIFFLYIVAPPSDEWSLHSREHVWSSNDLEDEPPKLAGFGIADEDVVNCFIALVSGHKERIACYSTPTCFAHHGVLLKLTNTRYIHDFGVAWVWNLAWPTLALCVVACRKDVVSKMLIISYVMLDFFFLLHVNREGKNDFPFQIV